MTTYLLTPNKDGHQPQLRLALPVVVPSPGVSIHRQGTLRPLPTAIRIELAELRTKPDKSGHSEPLPSPHPLGLGGSLPVLRTKVDKSGHDCLPPGTLLHPSARILTG